MSAPATTEGYKAIVGWARGHGSVECAGVEGTGSFGAGLARYLKGEGVEVREVVRPKRRDLHRSGKSDPIDAEAAARAVLAGTATGRPKSADGEVEMIRVLRAARRSAVKARAMALNQIRALLDTAPEEMKDGLRGLSSSKLVRKASCFRPGERPCDVLSATKLALRSVARRCRTLSEEISELDSQLDRLVVEAAPELLAVKGVGTDTAASLLIAAGDNPGRLDSEASFAHLCGVAPIPASSGRVVRHRLNRRGNRDANRRTLRGRFHPYEQRRAYPSVRGAAHWGGQIQKGDHSLPQEIHSSRNLQDPRSSVIAGESDVLGALTNIEASFDDISALCQ